jgi:hypothetical protein
MTVDSRYVFDLLRDEADFTRYRGIEPGTQVPILAVAVAAER